MSPTTTFNTCVVVNLDSINFKNSVEDNMRNLTLIIGLMGGCAYANAAPNIWSSSFNHGFDEYKVKTGQFCILEYDTFAQKLFIKEWNIAP